MSAHDDYLAQHETCQSLTQTEPSHCTKCGDKLTNDNVDANNPELCEDCPDYRCLDCGIV